MGKIATSVSVMVPANNEIGTIELDAVASMSGPNIIFTADAVQAIGYFSLSMNQLPVDYSGS